MLVLSRKAEQVICIGDETLMIGGKVIHITVLKVAGGTVKIGIDADKKVPVKRGELTSLPGQLLDEVA